MTINRIAVLFFLLVCCGVSHAQTTQTLIDSSRFYKNKDYSRSIHFAGLALKQAQQKGETNKAGEAEFLLGIANYLKGNFNEALRFYIESEKSYTTADNKRGLTELYEDMCILYLKLKKYKVADEVIKKAIEYSTETRSTDKLATAINNRGLVFSDQGMSDSAIACFKQSYSLYVQIKDITGQAYSLDYLSSALADRGNYDDALKIILQSKKLREGLGDKTGETVCAENIGEVYLKMNKPAAAAQYFLEAIQRAHAIKFTDIEAYAYNMLAQAYEVQGKFADAYQAQKKYVAMNQQLQDEKRIKTIEELEAHYQTNKKQEQIKLLNEQSTIQKLQISKRNITISIIAIVFVLAMVIAYQQYSRYKTKQETRLHAEILNQQNIAARGIIDAEERERKRIAGELHDGVGQLFTTVKMNLEILVERYINKQPDANILAEKTIALVDESCTEVRSIAHQMMPNALIKSGLVTALRDFINKIPAEKLKISMETKGIERGLETTTETVLYRVIQESVNNVIKHAQATQLDILLLCDEKEITVSIEDNGKGFKMNDKTKFTGIGIKNMINRVEYLKGTVDISSAPGKGTLVAIYIPLT